MKFSIATLALLVCAAPLLPANGEDASKETELIAVLESSTNTLQSKNAACAELKLLGTERCVPALAALLTDDNLSHSARYALELMSYPAAGKALLEALPSASGSNAVGIIYSLAIRGEKVAVPELIKTLSMTDPSVASAAAEALGTLGGKDAAKALDEASRSSTGAVHDAELDGLLKCANKFLTDGSHKQTLTVFQKLYDSAANPGVRVAAYRGVILASGIKGIELAAAAIAGSDPDSQGAALRLAAERPGIDMMASLVKLLPTVQPAVQIAVLQCLSQCDCPFASSAIVPLLDSDSSDVRLAAITALGGLGDGSAVRPLALKAASGSKDEKDAARSSLLNLHRGKVAEQFLALFDSAEPSAQLELIRALGGRGETSAVPKLLALAQSADDSVRTASLQALAQVAGPAQISALVQLVVKAGSDDARAAFADALSSACQHIESQGLPMDLEALITAVQSGPMEARLALLPVCSGLSEAPARDALRAAMKDSDPRIQEAAIRALSETRDGELLPDLLKMATSAQEEKIRLLAIRGCCQLTSQEGTSLSNAQKLDALKMIIAMPLAAPEKRLVLSGLGSIGDEGALALALPMLDDAAIQAEAAQAIIRISGAIASKHPVKAANALKKVIAITGNPDTKDSANAALKKIKIKK